MREGWEYKKLGEVTCYPNKRITLSELTPMEYVGVECMLKNKGGVSFSEELPNADAAVEFVENDILIGNIRPYLKKIWLSDRHGGASGDVVNIRVTEDYKDSISASYLYKVLSTDAFFEYDNSNTHGAKMPRGDRKAIAEYCIPIPPKTIQLAIVSELDQINDLIRLKKEQLKECDNLAQSIFYDMFGDPVENEKGWEVKKLGELSEKLGDGLHGTPVYCEHSGYFFVNGNNLENGTIVYTDKTKQVPKEEYLKYFIEFGKQTLFVSINGTIGKMAYYSGEKIILGKSACYINLKPEINKVFIYNILASSYFKKYTLGEKTGSTISNVSLKSMRNFPVPLPPLPLQQEFSSRIEQIEKLKTEVQKTITDLETLLASRMQYWFE